jgi:calnexin
LTFDKNFKAKDFNDKTPYTISNNRSNQVFGPDKCGGNNKVHFIFRHENPITHVFEEKHLKNPPKMAADKKTNLYTLIVKPDQTFIIKINNESVKEGSLLKDFDPPVNPPVQIDDPNDKKPKDWVDEAKILDPNAKKPDDWDEDAPLKIPDPEEKVFFNLILDSR